MFQILHRWDSHGCRFGNCPHQQRQPLKLSTAERFCNSTPHDQQLRSGTALDSAVDLGVFELLLLRDQAQDFEA